MRNLLTDVAGLSVGHAEDARLASGVSVILADAPAIAAVSQRGGAPGGRDTGLLAPDKTIAHVDAVVLSGGSAFGLDAAGGVQAVLRAAGRGYAVGAARVPIVVGAILFDLLNGGDKDWDMRPPYWELGRQAAEAARAGAFALGSVGAGLGATTVNLKGGLGSASIRLPSGHTVAALATVNAIGAATIGDGPYFWAAPYERHGEFGGRGWPHPLPPPADVAPVKGHAARLATPATTIACVATDAVLSKSQAAQLATMADDGLARALRPAHAPMDGDTVFALATGRLPLADPIFDLTQLGAAAADCLARAIARGVYEAIALPFPGALPAWRDRFGP